MYNDRRCIRTYIGHKQAVRDVTFNNSGTEFLSCAYDRYCKLWDTETGMYVQRKVRIGTIPELYLHIVRIPTLSADSGIVPDNSRIAQGVFYRFLL